MHRPPHTPSEIAARFAPLVEHQEERGLSRKDAIEAVAADYLRVHKAIEFVLGKYGHTGLKKLTDSR